MPIFWRVLIINGCWILSKAFSASVEMITWFLSFNLLIWCITLIHLCILKNPCIPGITQLDHGVWAFWCVAEFWLLKFFDDFCIYVHQWYWPEIFFFSVVFVWFWYQGDRDLIEWVWKCSLLYNFWKSIRMRGISSSLNVWYNSPVKPPGSGLLIFWEIFDHRFNFSACNWVVH